MSCDLCWYICHVTCIGMSCDLPATVSHVLQSQMWILSVCVCVHVAFTYMHIHDCTFTEIRGGRARARARARAKG